MANIDDEDITLDLDIDNDSEDSESDNDEGQIGEVLENSDQEAEIEAAETGLPQAYQHELEPQARDEGEAADDAAASAAAEEMADLTRLEPANIGNWWVKWNFVEPIWKGCSSDMPTPLFYNIYLRFYWIL